MYFELPCVSVEHSNSACHIEQSRVQSFTMIAMGYSKWHHDLYKLVVVINYHKWRYIDTKRPITCCDEQHHC